jgi:4-hydroxy-tetrahydrodipicolinate synthase
MTARRWHHALAALMQVNFVESNPIPVKFAMAAMGLCEEVFRLPMVSPSAASQQKVLAVLKEFGLPVVADVPA